MNNKLRIIALSILALGFSVFAEQASAQYGYNNCNRGYGVGYSSYSYGYNAPVSVGYSSYYAGYPGYSSYHAQQVYSGNSLYVSPGYYSAARVAVPAYPVYRPVYRPVVVPVPVGPRIMPVPGIGLRIGF